MDTNTANEKYSSSLRYSLWDAVFFSLMFGFGESYLSAYGVHLEASATQIGILATFPLWIGALTQRFGVFVMERSRSRRKILLTGVIFQALTWIPIALLPYMTTSPANRSNLLILFTCTYFMGGHFVSPVWTSLIGDLVPPEIRGAYFGGRSRAAGLALIVSVLTAGLFLDWARGMESAHIAFLVIFLSATLFRLVSAYFLSRHEDPPYAISIEDRFTFFQFLRKLPSSNFARFSLFHAMIYFSSFLAAPYYIVFMLRELHFSYFQYTVLIITALIANVLTMQRWGKFGDRFGNRSILRTCSYGLCAIPFFWTLNHSFHFLIIVQAYAGFIWAGFQLGSSNFLFDAVSTKKRARCSAYLWILTASAIAFGSFLGGNFLDYVSHHDPSSGGIFPFTAIFLLSGSLQLLVVALIGWRFQEVKDVEPLSSRKRYFRIPSMHPFVGGGVRIVGMGIKGKFNRYWLGEEKGETGVSGEKGEQEKAKGVEEF